MSTFCNRIIPFISLFAFVACDAFEYHPHDAKITGDTNINAKNIALIENKCAGKTSFRFAFVSDTQGWSDETEKFVKALNARDDIDFVVHGGDIADFGVTKEFLWQRDILNKLKVPYVVIIGNHDCLGTGPDVYKKIFGAENFAFVAGNVKFLCLNTNALEYDYSNPIPDFQFLENHIRAASTQKSILVMHGRPYSDVFNNNVAKVFQGYITQLPSLQFCLNGHDHAFQMEDLFDDGIIYYGTPNIEKKAFLLFTINPEGYEYEMVEF